jgi:hypothetical protein
MAVCSENRTEQTLSIRNVLQAPRSDWLSVIQTKEKCLKIKVDFNTRMLKQGV